MDQSKPRRPSEAREKTGDAVITRDVGVLQPGYLPWMGYFDLAALSNVFVIYDDVQFDKGGWRNRNRLLANGQPQWITVPVAQGLGRNINQVVLPQSSWQKKHLQTIRTLYGRAPYFSQVFPHIEKYLTRKNYTNLLDLCIEGHHTLCGLLDIRTEIRLSSDIGYEGIGKTERLVAICRSLAATRYIATNASKVYMEDHMWQEAGIDLVYQDYHHPMYEQFGRPFVSHLSIIDALMFAGPDTRAHIGVSLASP